MALAPRWIDGFEHGSVGTGNGAVYDAATGTAAIVTTPVRSGLRALQIDTTAAAKRVSYQMPSNGPVTSTTWGSMGVAVRFPSLPADSTQIFSYGNANGAGVVQFNTGTNHLELTFNNTTNTDFGPTIATDTWYYVETEVDFSTGTAVFRGRVDNGAVTAISRSQTSSTITGFTLGTQTTDTLNAFYDDWVICTTKDNSQRDDSFPGDGRIVSLIVDGDGAHNITTAGDFDSFTGTAFDNTTTTGWTFIDHRPLQLANTADNLIRQELGTSANYMTFTFEDLPAVDANTTIAAAVRAYCSRVESSGTGTSGAEFRLLLSDGTEVLSTGPATNSASTNYYTAVSVGHSAEDMGLTLWLHRRMTDPPGGQWTREKVNGLQGRVGFGDGSPDVNFIDYMLEVLLKPASPALPRNDSLVVPMLGPEVGW